MILSNMRKFVIIFYVSWIFFSSLNNYSKSATQVHCTAFTINFIHLADMIFVL